MWPEIKKLLLLLKIQTMSRLLNCIDRRKLTFLGHFVRQDGLGKELIIGSEFCKPKIGRPKTRYKDNFKNLTNLGIVQVYRKEQGRQEWRQFVKDATADQPNDLIV